jgi:helicase required for RNAi-mediated heterochromatin assembly 1
MESMALQILGAHIHRTWDTGNHHEQWRDLPEIPTKLEIMPEIDENTRPRSREEKWNDYQNDPVYDSKLPKNIIDGPWPSKESYISAHYQILREDAVAPLREAIKSFKQHPNMNDDNDICVYTRVRALIRHLGIF